MCPIDGWGARFLLICVFDLINCEFTVGVSKTR